METVITIIMVVIWVAIGIGIYWKGYATGKANMWEEITENYSLFARKDYIREENLASVIAQLEELLEEDGEEEEVIIDGGEY